ALAANPGAAHSSFLPADEKVLTSGSARQKSKDKSQKAEIEADVAPTFWPPDANGAAGLSRHATPAALRPAGVSSSPNHQGVANYGKLPLRFEANQGQTDSHVKFLARGRGYALFLTGNQAVLKLGKSPVVSGHSSVESRQEARTRASVAPTLRSARAGVPPDSGPARAGLKPGATK